MRASFERELRQKLEQKSKNPQQEEALLIISFKFFDLDNSGTISKEEFVKAVEKIGIQIFNIADFYDLF
jgi:Ca2+-binding EF-hand superfamily protein